MNDEQQSTEGAGPGRNAARGKRAALRFVLVFLGLVIAFQVLFWFAITPSAFFRGYMEATAVWTARLLGWVGEDASASGDLLMGSGVVLALRTGCDGIQPASIFAAAVLAFPGSVRSKLIGLVLGVSALQVFNLVRVATLYFMSRDFPESFQTFHETLLPTGLIILALLLWMVWVVLGTPKRTPEASS